MMMDTAVDPEQFEIQISDLNDIDDFTENVLSENGAGYATSNADGSDSDLLRASLSDVVIAQSLQQFATTEIDFDDNKQKVYYGRSSIQNFDNVIIGANVQTDNKIDEEFSNIFSGISKKTSDHVSVTENTIIPATPCKPQLPQPSPQQPRPQLNSLSTGDSPLDFEDALDPTLLTSIHKVSTDRDSDEEFDFDFPKEKGKEPEVRSDGKTSTAEEARKPILTLNTIETGQAGHSAGLHVISVGIVAVPMTASQNQAMQAEVPAVSPSAAGFDFGKTDRVNSTQVEDNKEETEESTHIITSSAADWDNVETVEAGFHHQGGGVGESMTTAPTLLAFSDMWQHFLVQDHSGVKDKILVTVEKTGIWGIIHRLFGSPRLVKHLHMERELVFCAAATAFDNADRQHTQSLQTIYQVLTGSRFNCQRYGSHWEQIGFQGRDPATDLRGTGMLALIQLVYFLQDENTVHLARNIFKLSLHPSQNFPFCIMCINITRIVLQVLREGMLNRECNRQQKVLAVVNQFYAGSLLHLYQTWKQGKTIKDSGFVIKDIETRAKKNT